WAGLGIGAAALLVYATRYRLTGYLYLARHLLPALWLLLASLMFRLLRRFGNRVSVATLVFGLLVLLVRPTLDYESGVARAMLHASHRVSALTDMALLRSPTSTMRLDVLSNHDFACESLSKTHT